MDNKEPVDYEVEDFVIDESFINYHFHLDINDYDFWEKWLIEHPGNQSVANAAKEMLQTLSLTLPDNEFQEELAKIKKAVKYQPRVFKTSKPNLLFRLFSRGSTHHSGRHGGKRSLKIAATVLLPLIIGGFFLFQHLTKPGFELNERYNHSSSPVVFMLSDSTVVTLAPQSSLQYPGKFDKKDRRVYLEGEAQFHVKKDMTHPFKVFAGEVVTTVLGTVFNIKQQPQDSTVQIELLTGKLKVEIVDSAGIALQATTLYPDERIVYNRRQQKMYKETWQLNEEEVAVVNHIEFHQENFTSIAQKLKSAFGITVINLSDKKDWRFTGEFKNSTAKDIIENICIIKNLSYQVQADTIFIK